jgi:voltage-gated potassium channel
MTRLRLLHQIMRTTQMYGILTGFIIYFIITAIIIWLVDPAVDTLGDSLWFCFVSCTTIGFGDIVPTGMLARILTVIMTIYGILLVATVSGVIVSYFTEFSRMRANKSTTEFLYQLEHLDELSKEELRKISEKVKERSKKL